MDNIKNIVTGTIITILIGGTAYTVSTVDIAKHFADDTGLTQEQAEQYINEIPEDELASWDKVGYEFVTFGQEILNGANSIDCVNYEYDWESNTLSCLEGKKQIEKLGQDSNSLGQAYIRLASDSGSLSDIYETITLIDKVNSDLELKFFGAQLDWSTIDELKKTNLYNKAVLKAVLESEQTE